MTLTMEERVVWASLRSTDLGFMRLALKAVRVVKYLALSLIKK